jgi:sugar O-acyltransferase (sialic acid O-acetyltransferase NeuD family)
VQIKDENLILVGAGAFGRELVNWSYDVAAATGGAPITGFLDNDAHALDKFGYDLEYRGTIEAYQPREGDRLVMAIGDPLVKKRIAGELLAKGAQFASLVHPRAVVARNAVLGAGVVVCPNAVISANATVGAFVAVNALSGVGHDVVLGDYTTLSSHVDLTGWVRVGEACFFGSGARVLPKVSVGEGARIGAGAVVMRNVAPGATMFAAPAKKL